MMKPMAPISATMPVRPNVFSVPMYPCAGPMSILTYI